MTDPTKSRDELISSFSSKLFSAMLQEVIMDATLNAHKDIRRGKTMCPVCGTRCGSTHARGGKSNGAGPSNSGPSSIPPSAPSSPPPAGAAAAGTSTPTAKDRNDGNIYFECTNCQKKIASNRYAPHLSGCLGIGTGSRRGAARNAAARNKLGAEIDRSGTPIVGHERGSPSLEAVNGREKGKAKSTKKINGKDPELNGNQKRPSTPDNPSAKKGKKQKTSAAGPDTAILVGEGISIKSHSPTSSKVPVKPATLPASPNAPGSPSGFSGSQYSGRDSPSASVSVSGSSFNAQSPTASRGSKPPITYKTVSASLQKKRGRPPGTGRHQTAQVPGAEGTAAKQTEGKEEDPDFIDVDGEEQEGSSSDSS